MPSRNKQVPSRFNRDGTSLFWPVSEEGQQAASGTKEENGIARLRQMWHERVREAYE